jgi:large subunit ribosomal protein L9
VQVILLSDVDNLGLRGDIVDVAPGYARNFLLPRRLAENATEGRVAQVRRVEELRARQEARTLEHAREIADTLTKTVLRFEVNAGPTGSLFGSVTPTDIVDELWRARRIRVDRRKVDLPEPIKRVGRYEIPIDVFEDVRVDVKTLVVPEGGELPPEEETPAVEAPEAEETSQAAEAAAPDEAAVAVAEAQSADAQPEAEQQDE